MIAIDHLRHVNVESARTASVRCRAVDPGSRATLLAPGPNCARICRSTASGAFAIIHAPGHMLVTNILDSAYHA
ncbi:hypothetical protein RPHASCH2410_CH17070 [Rhizobium phaseoli Ch24-10]|nr:hypothetical protein RPHASCH2410_CH17070 [Rhizobium phaseoli Ch24-10]